MTPRQLQEKLAPFKQEQMSTPEREPMTAERDSELRGLMVNHHYMHKSCSKELFTEIDRLRDENSSLRESLANKERYLVAERKAHSETSQRMLQHFTTGQRQRDEALGRVRALEGEMKATFTDERGTVWARPTAWAYAQACRALNNTKECLAALSGERCIPGVPEGMRVARVIPLKYPSNFCQTCGDSQKMHEVGCVVIGCDCKQFIEKESAVYFRAELEPIPPAESADKGTK